MSVEPTIEQPVAPPSPAPWGFWSTLGWSLAIGTAFVAIQTVVTVVYIFVRVAMQPGGKLEVIAEQATSDGLLLALASWVSMPPALGLVLLAARLRRGYSMREYLSLRPVSWIALAVWLGVLCLFVVATDTVTHLLGRPVVPPIMRDLYNSAAFPPLLWSALLIAAPVFEECMFRGFMLEGLRRSWLGTAGAIVVTSLCWAAIHLQYDFYAIAVIFLGGLFLGAARIRTGSIYVPIAMHALMNLIATVEAAVVNAG